MKVEVKQIEKVKLTSSAMLRFDVLSIDDIDFNIGKHAICKLLESFMYEFKKNYDVELLVEILQEPDFEDVLESLADKEIRRLKEEKRQLKGNLDITLGLVKIHQKGKKHE